MGIQLQSAVVTGPTGVLGTALVHKLAQENLEIFVVCHPGSKRNATIPKGKNIHKIECEMEEFLHLPYRIGQKVDAFFHLAWLGTQDNNNRMNMYLQIENIKYTIDSVYAAHKLGCKVYIGAGSQAEFGRVDGVLRPDLPEKPLSGYGMAKLCSGQMTRALCKEFGIRHIWPRVVSIYGINDAPKTLVSTVIEKLLREEKPALTAGEQEWDYLYSGDAADAFYYMAANGRDGATYVLGSGKTRLLKDFMMAIRDAVEPSLPLGIGEIPYLPDQAMHLEADVSALTKDTGWIPATDFEKGIRYVVNAMREAKNLKIEYKS